MASMLQNMTRLAYYLKMRAKSAEDIELNCDSIIIGGYNLENLLLTLLRLLFEQETRLAEKARPGGGASAGDDEGTI